MMDYWDEGTCNLHCHISLTEVRESETMGLPLNLHIPEDHWQSKQHGTLSLLKALIEQLLFVQYEGCLMSCSKDITAAWLCEVNNTSLMLEDKDKRVQWMHLCLLEVSTNSTQQGQRLQTEECLMLS